MITTIGVLALSALVASAAFAASDSEGTTAGAFGKDIAELARDTDAAERGAAVSAAAKARADERRADGSRRGAEDQELVTEDEDDENEDEDGTSERKANHGAAVSAVAKSTEPGPGHGAAVREVARQNAGADQRPATVGQQRTLPAQAGEQRTLPAQAQAKAKGKTR